MNEWQSAFVVLYALVNVLVFFKGFYESKRKQNAYGLTPFLLPLGIIAWGDAVIFGPFWILVSVAALVLGDWYLFLLILSVFWAVRSIGEVAYWFNQQFSSKVYEWNKPERLFWYSVFHDDFAWCAYQMAWQCVAVISVVCSIYFASVWIGGIL